VTSEETVCVHDRFLLLSAPNKEARTLLADHAVIDVSRTSMDMFWLLCLQVEDLDGLS
jgi:hypothetical protein